MSKIFDPIEETQSVLNTDSFDRRRFADLLSKSKNMAQLSQDGSAELPTFQPLMNDIWASLYKTKPKLKELENLDGSYHANRNFMKQVMELDGFDEFRKSTMLDDLSSAIGTLRYSEKVNDWVTEQRDRNDQLNKALEDAMKQQQEMQQAQEQMQQAQKEQEQAQNDVDNANQNGDDQQQKQAQKRANKAQKQAQQAQEQMQQASQSMNQSMQQAQQMMSNALSKENGKSQNSLQSKFRQAQQETNEGKEALDNLMGIGAGTGSNDDLQKVPLRDKIVLAEVLRKNKKLKRIAEWAGKFKSIARQKRKSKTEESSERSGVTIGTDVERLLPQELAFFSHEVTKTDFLRRYSEGQTMVYAPEGKEEVGKGPIVVCLDQSGSMWNLDEQSKGFLLALAMIAKKERRDFAVVLFSSGANFRTFVYPKGKINSEKLVELATTFLDGGTDFCNPLKEAVRVIKQNKRFKKADILFVTDGEPSDYSRVVNYSKDVLQPFKEKHDVSIMSVLLGGTREQAVKVFSDKVVHGKDFMNDAVTDAFKI
ncbi:vWA domain-containing protein [Anaerobacillus isosaccharinicus]|uniref:VWA domain-containing protein n=1 Tax=Anaerobacillus isosaccharinicus TaxID=1532552 RepID=A0A1S2KY93_9BACI|nr:VWA domain-containing protein [Anaerobacillus isosaccharinicus]MBA5588914.1 VWA domain-containing protein [Anaerobacillus isosaccharinicus]QOY37675.1 VWA domain-containing protein [Anaerobacillus isosaccharinicus]